MSDEYEIHDVSCEVTPCTCREPIAKITLRDRDTGEDATDHYITGPVIAFFIPDALVYDLQFATPAEHTEFGPLEI